jgi:hypothetical protein
MLSVYKDNTKVIVTGENIFHKSAKLQSAPLETTLLKSVTMITGRLCSNIDTCTGMRVHHQSHGKDNENQDSTIPPPKKKA